MVDRLLLDRDERGAMSRGHVDPNDGCRIRVSNVTKMTIRSSFLTLGSSS